MRRSSTTSIRARRRQRLAVVGSASAALLAAGGVLTGAGAAAASAAPVTIKAELPPATGTIDNADNAGLKKLTLEYEKAHPNVTVDWLPVSVPSITEDNAQLETQAAGGAAPDIVGEQYGPVTSGSLPAGLLQDIKPYLEKPNPYVPGNKSWLSLFSSSTVPYMTSSNGDIDILLGSNVETGMFYSKAAFAKAGITGTPATWSQFMTDLGKLKAAGITPFIFGDGGLCNPSWFERLTDSSLLANETAKFDVDHSQVTSGLDVAVGIKRGIISMSNPRYAETWKLLAQLVKYSASGESSYDACSSPTASTPPLSTEPLLTGGKVGIYWGASPDIPQLSSAGFANKFGVFPEPTITKATTPFALGTDTRGVIGGPNGNGEWSITSEKADHTMTPAKTAVVMNFLAWLYTPKNLGSFIATDEEGSDIPTEPTAPIRNLPGLKSLVPPGKVPTVVDVALDDVLSTATTTSGLRLVQAYVDGSLSYSSFASQWQSLLQSGAQAWASANHVNLSKY